MEGSSKVRPRLLFKGELAEGCLESSEDYQCKEVIVRFIPRQRFLSRVRESLFEDESVYGDRRLDYFDTDEYDLFHNHNVLVTKITESDISNFRYEVRFPDRAQRAKEVPLSSPNLSWESFSVETFRNFNECVKFVEEIVPEANDMELKPQKDVFFDFRRYEFERFPSIFLEYHRTFFLSNESEIDMRVYGSLVYEGELQYAKDIIQDFASSFSEEKEGETKIEDLFVRSEGVFEKVVKGNDLENNYENEEEETGMNTFLMGEDDFDLFPNVFDGESSMVSSGEEEEEESVWELECEACEAGEDYPIVISKEGRTVSHQCAGSSRKVNMENKSWDDFSKCQHYSIDSEGNLKKPHPIQIDVLAGGNGIVCESCLQVLRKGEIKFCRRKIVVSTY